VITELALERVEFTCGHCWHRWSIDYDVQHYRDDNGNEWEYFYRDGVATISPYASEGALPCPECGRHWVGHIVARREIPTAPGSRSTPRQRISDAAGHRRERRDVPLLGAGAHAQPEAEGDAGAAQARR
jgi:hypothetical protein